MKARDRTLDVERLLAQSDWARGLALRLVGDAHLAEDVVQDAWVAALERPPGETRLREWFASVVRNLALRRRRREAARDGVERGAVACRTPAGPDEALARLELQRRLAEHVLALAEPCRTALVLRHFEGLSAREIALRTSCSEEAARQRVARGLAKLRERIDGRTLGAFALVWGGTRDQALAGAGLIGGTLVGTKTVVAAAACAVLGGAWWFAGRGAGEPRPAMPTAARAVAPASPSDSGGLALESTSPVEAVARRDALALPARAREPAALRGRCIDDRGLPLADVVVQVLEELGDDSRAATTSDAAGAFALALHGLSAPADGGWRVQAHLAGHVSADVEHAGPDLGDLVLARRPLVIGVVLRPDGSPAAPRGRVELSVVDAAGVQAWTHVEIDERGRFQADGLAPGRLVEARCLARGFAPGESRPGLELAPGSRHELELVLQRGDVVRGVVVDSLSGEPVPFAEVWSESWVYDRDSIEPSTVADESGRFELCGVRAHAVANDSGVTAIAWVSVTARAAGYLGRPFEPTTLRRGENGELGQLVIRIVRADASVRGRLTWSDGSAAVGVPVYVVDDGMNLKMQVSDAQGRFGLEGLAPGPLAICARTDPEHPDAPHGRVEARLELAAAARESVDLVLAPAVERISGRVLDEHGAGLAGVAIEAGEHFFSGKVTLGLGLHRALTDAQGRYELANLTPGRYQVEIATAGRRERAARPEHVTVELAAGEARSDVDFRSVPAVVVAGWVDVGDADPTAYEVARVRPEDGEELASLKPDADGRFRFEGCWPEACALVLRDKGRELARIEIGPAGGQGLVLAATR